MQVSVETTNGLERKVTVGIPADNIDSEVNKRLVHLSKTQRMAGFRPGKIPLSVVKKRFGAPVKQEVLQEVMQRSFYEAINQEKLQPAGQPLIQPGKLEEGKDFEFTATFEVFPEVTVGDFKKLKIERLTSEIADEDVAKMMETLQKQRAEWESVNRMARKDDMVVIDFKGSIDGVEFEGGAAEDYSLVLGSDSMIPGFEKQLLKIKKGEERDITVTFPEDYHSEELAGKEAVFNINCKDVKGQKLPELTDEFAAEFGVEEGGIEKLTEEVKKNMQRELDMTLKSKNKAAVMEALQEANEVDLPKSLVDQEIESLRQQTLAQFNRGRQGSAADLPEMPADLFEEQAKKRVALALTVGEIISANELKVDPDRVRSTIESIASAYDEPEQMVNWYYQNQQQLQQIEATVLEEQVVDLILDSAKVTEKSVAFDEVMGKQG